MENLPQYIDRLKREVADLRETERRILKVGQSSAFGGVSINSAQLKEVRTALREKESDLYNAEAALAGTSGPEWGVSEVRISAA